MPGTHYEETTPEGEKRLRYLDMGENPPEGVILNYFLESETQETIELVILDGKGVKIDRFFSKNSSNDPIGIDSEDVGLEAATI